MLQTRLEISGTKASSCFTPFLLLAVQPSVFLYIYILPQHKGDASHKGKDFPPTVNIVFWLHSFMCHVFCCQQRQCRFVLTCNVTCLHALLLFSPCRMHSAVRTGPRCAEWPAGQPVVVRVVDLLCEQPSIPVKSFSLEKKVLYRFAGNFVAWFEASAGV